MIVEPFVHCDGKVDPNLVVETQTVKFDVEEVRKHLLSPAEWEEKMAGFQIAIIRDARRLRSGWRRDRAEADAEIIGRHPRWADRNGGLSKDFDNAEL